ncbi:MAG: adenylate/guanylate cyclase domain-containing protein [Gammaproteobacteria bacterium]|nr:adenylate/guanylate cyclase domain-containing protein [Gammaproteobacteria bacterium]NNJ51068.1 adenylate/guanylate cyclase domain-containing protein [Gammaproteobacteria bacterium]
MGSLSDNHCAIMFADIAGSTRLYKQLGDDKAELLISTRLDIMCDITANNNGRVIKKIGDEIMCQFPTAEDAALAATEMHIKKVTSDTVEPLNIRVGLHYGNIIARDNDIFGDAVNIAARMAAIAKANQSITTEGFVRLLSSESKSKTRLFDSARVKGIDEEIKIYQILWEEGNVTTFATAHHILQVSQANLSIVLMVNSEERFYTDSDMNTAISIGRDDACDITVDAKFASRSHVDLEFRRGKFVLLDHSTNGTYVKLNDQNDIFIRREELPLIGEGHISLGEDYRSENTNNIYFSILQKQ